MKARIIEDGDIISGFDFGCVRNHITGARIRVNFSKPGKFDFLSFETIDLGNKSCRTRLQTLVQTESPLWESDWFVLEAQVARNIPCFVLAHALEVMLLCRGVSETRIFTMPSRRKFKLLDKGNVLKPPVRVKKTSVSHAHMKLWSVNVATHMLLNNSESTEFHRAKKKDDFADALLSAVAFLWEQKKHRVQRIDEHFTFTKAKVPNGKDC